MSWQTNLLTRITNWMNQYDLTLLFYVQCLLNNFYFILLVFPHFSCSGIGNPCQAGDSAHHVTLLQIIAPLVKIAQLTLLFDVAPSHTSGDGAPLYFLLLFCRKMPLAKLQLMPLCRALLCLDAL